MRSNQGIFYMSEHDKSKEELGSRGVEVNITDLPTLPEHLRDDSIDGLLPDQVVYAPANSVLGYDRQTKGIYLATEYSLSRESYAPPAYLNDKGGSVAVMRAMRPDGVMGFVVDATGVRPGDVSETEDMFQLGVEGILSDYYAEKRSKNIPPDAIAFLNIDGEPAYYGDPAFFDALATLVDGYSQEIDKMRELRDRDGVHSSALGVVALDAPEYEI